MLIYWAVNLLMSSDLTFVMALIIVGMIMMSLILLMDMNVDYNEYQIIF